MPLNILEELLAESQAWAAKEEIDGLLAAVERVPAIRDGIRVLAAFGASVEPGLRFHREGDRYVGFPKNFVAFTPRVVRANHVTIELRGAPSEYLVDPVLPLNDARAGSYSSCEFKSVRHLAAAASYLQRSHELYLRGRNRSRRTPRVEEVPVSAVESQ